MGVDDPVAEDEDWLKDATPFSYKCLNVSHNNLNILEGSFQIVIHYISIHTIKTQYSMGLGAKIKEALHGDHHDQTTSDAKAPGAYPDDDLPQKKHSDGKQYVAPHGSLVDKKGDTAGVAGTHASDRKGTGL